MNSDKRSLYELIFWRCSDHGLVDLPAGQTITSTSDDALYRIIEPHIPTHGPELYIATNQFTDDFARSYKNGSLSDLDRLYQQLPGIVELSVDDFIALKRPKVRSRLAALRPNLTLDEEQEQACARPESRLLIRARAGSGKTRTLCTRAGLAMRDEGLKPDQVMVLAFNKNAAFEVRKRVRKAFSIPDYKNARTFHSLAHKLVQPKKNLLFNKGGEPQEKEQSAFVEKLLHRLLNPAFKEKMVEFFRKELEQVEDLGRDLPPEEYLAFRRSLEHYTLGGEKVKSNGEKFIADFLFEHGIEYKYEKPWEWKVGFLDGAAYRPDFSIVANGRDYVLEHWAFDPADRFATLPQHWEGSAAQYRNQISAKREFWRSKGIALLETHTGMMRGGREAFEGKLRCILKEAGIQCHRLPEDEIIRRVFDNNFAISRMAELFLQFIQRSKKRGWSVDETAQRLAEKPDNEPRACLFHDLALRVYREYEAALEQRQAMDFDDLLMQAVEEVKARGASATIHLGDGRMIRVGELKWILVDEYQDFSELFFRLLAAILNVNEDMRLVAVGDDWQAINAFAGAELRFFERFATYFSSSETVGVTTNYRSDRLVVEAGNRLMAGRGSPAMISASASSGQIETQYIDDVWIEFRKGAEYQQAQEADALFLPRDDGQKGPSGTELRQAQALKLCAQIILAAPERQTMLLARTGRVYGLELKAFRQRLVCALVKLCNKPWQEIDNSIDAMTAHGSKGQEASRVIILDVTKRQFPKVHPDNLLFEPFGVTPKTVLAEERRLFYVAITRAEKQLYFLTEKGEESPYLKVIGKEFPMTNRDTHSNVTSEPLGELAKKIRAQIETCQLSELEAALGAAGIPNPEKNYQLTEDEKGVRAVLAWPCAPQPTAILSEDQWPYAHRWRFRGWRAASLHLPIAAIVKGVEKYSRKRRGTDVEARHAEQRY